MKLLRILLNMVAETYISDFHIIDPPYSMTQEKGLEWLLKAHLASEKTKRQGSEGASFKLFEEEIKEAMRKVCCKPAAVAKRGYAIDDFHQENWEEMPL